MINPWFPLPDDYGTLTKEGQKLARLTAIKDQGTPEKLAQAWEFFRNIYLKPMGEMFYPSGFVKSPAFHYQAVADLGTYARNAMAAPRGSAKSTVIGKEVPLLLLLTRPDFRIAMGLATDSLVEARFDEIMLQLTENPLILEDFGVQRPKRGSAIWNHHHLHLANGATLQGFSVVGRKRGARPRLFILDDPENDPDSESQQAQQILLEKFERILFRQIIPMLEHGAAIFWIGTLIHRRCFLFHACCSDDPRFKFWNRRVFQAITEDATGISVLWKEKWPKEVLDARRDEMGDSAFSAEYLNAPVSANERILNVHPRANEYNVTGEPTVPDNPFDCTEEVTWFERAEIGSSLSDAKLMPEAIDQIYKECRKPYRELVAPLFRILAFDYAQGLSQHSDYSCIVDMGYDTYNNLWILDGWMGRAKDADLLQLIYMHGLKWQHRVLGIESASIQISFAEAVNDYVEKQTRGAGWRPRVMPVKYPANVSKSSRIAGLEWRFRRGRIKYPAHLAHKWPFNMLYMQTQDFTTDLALLRFDDAIDTVAMNQYIVHTSPTQGQTKLDPLKRPLAERIQKNIPIVRGLPILSGIDPTTLTQEDLNILLARNYKERYNNAKGKRFVVRRPTISGGFV